MTHTEDLESSSSSDILTGADTSYEEVALISPLPCEDPSLSASGVTVFGRRSESEGRVRTESTSVNRVDFLGVFATVRQGPLELLLDLSQDTMEEASYKGFKLNCFKKKRKVDSMLELYDKECVNSLQDREIYKQKLEEISGAALDAVEYINELIEQLEINQEVDRISELTVIKNTIKESVRKNEREVKCEMQKIIDEVEAKVPTQASLPVAGDGGLMIGSHPSDTMGPGTIPYSFSVNPNTEAKLQLRLSYIQEDAKEIDTTISAVKAAKDLLDSEVIYFMREGKNWTKRVDELVSENRKFQLESFGFASLAESASELDTTVKNVKTLKDAKLVEIAKEDESRGLSSLCENKNKASIVFPEPFKGLYGENVFKFKEEITAAIRDSQTKKADEVRTLLKYLKGDAKSRVGDHQPTLEAALKTLVAFYGNANLIWMKCKQDFEQSFAGDVNRHWGDLGTTKRVDAIAKVMEFIRQAKHYAEEYSDLKEEIISSHTVTLLTKTMPLDYLEMVYLAIENVAASPSDKIDKIEEILGKLKTCGILAVNQLVNKEPASRPERNRVQHVSSRDPLGQNSYGVSCSVDVRHDCTRSHKCQPSWGLLGCVEMYRLQTVQERVEYCKESNCCTVCGSGNLSRTEEISLKHRRCDYRKPVDRFITKCTAWRSKDSTGRKLFCYYGAALCKDHQNLSNTNPKLLEWLKENKIKHEMFTMEKPIVSNKKQPVAKNSDVCEDHLTDERVMDMLRDKMDSSDFESGHVQDLPAGQNMFMFFLLQGKSGTEPIQVFGDSGANFWFATEAVTKKLVCVRTQKGAIPINIAGGKVIHATGEWAAAIPLADGSYQAVRGLTMKHVVGQMPRYDLTKTLSRVKNDYRENSRLQELVIPSVLGGEIDMILGSKYLKIYPEPIQVTPSGLTVSMSRLRSPGGMKTAVISGPVEFIDHIFQSKRARDSIESMKAMLVHLADYKPTLEHFPQPAHLAKLCDEDIPGIDMIDPVTGKLSDNGNAVASVSHHSCALCGVTVQGEMQKFMELQEAGLKTEYRCKRCRQCEDCRKGAGQERLSLKQEAEQELVRQSITLKDAGVAVAKLPFILPPESNLKNNRHIALKMLDRILKKYCSEQNQREIVWKAWQKMIDKGHLVFLKDLPKQQQKMLETASVSYYIPWNLQFKDSISTPIRPVFNGSSSTSTGLSLNDCLAKGTPDLVRLLSIMLEWQLGRNSFCGDISQFYPTIHLDPDHWCFQRILLREQLNPSGELLEGVLVKLAFGIQSVSAQSEEAVKRVAQDLWTDYPKVASLLTKNRYVDDIAKATNSIDESLSLTNDVSKILHDKLSMEIKGWCYAGKSPPPEVTKDGVSVDIGGHSWYTESDMFSINIPPICLTKKQRGRLPEGVYGYDPKTMKLEEFVPVNLTRRMCTSTVAKVWDPLGKLAPITLRLKHDLRKLILESPEWDSAISKQARSLWLQNFSTIEDIRGLLYMRCSRPSDALRNTCRIWIMVDAAEWGMMLTAYVGWERKDRSYSCSHLFGKGLLGPESLTLPQKELHILNVGADTSELFRVVLSDWVEEVLVAGDSEIALCWVGYESVKLNMYNRVRVINIVSKLDLDNLFHVSGGDNPADIGTRLKGIKSQDVYPGSDYLCGKAWMKLSKEDAIKQGTIRPLDQIKLGHEQRKVLKRGIVFDEFEKEDLDVVGVLMVARVDTQKVADREVHACYLYSPLLRNFLSLIEVTAVVLKAVKCFKGSSEQNELSHTDGVRFSAASYFSDQVVRAPTNKLITDADRNFALDYIYKKETEIVKAFMPAKKLQKIAVEEDGILYCKSRVLEGQNVKIVGGLRIDTSLKGLFNLNFKVPIVDQHSPLAYPLALHFHSLFNHRGIESTYRLSLNYARILGGMKIMRNISLNCAVCIKDRKRYLKMVMGGLTDSQLSISPLFYFTIVDLWGPLKAYCPGYGKMTRREKGYEVYFMVFSCAATGAVNLQLLEGKSTEFILEGCTRFFNETSVPKVLYPDEDGALVKAFREGEINIRDLAGNLHKTKGIDFELCPPQGHSSHGRVERVIRSLQESYAKSGASSSRLTALGWTTIGKALEREINDVPIGFLYEKSSADGNPILRVLRPSSLKGMNCSDRAPAGLFRIPDHAEEHFQKVQDCYNLWATCWATSYLPLIMIRQKWQDEDPSLSVNDLVYFMLDEKVLKPDWRVGKVESVKVGRDGKVREINISYRVMKEDTNLWSHSVVTRPIRKVIKLFDIKDTTFSEDMLSVQKAVKALLESKGEAVTGLSSDGIHLQDAPGKSYFLPEHQGVNCAKVTSDLKPFISCTSVKEWENLDQSGYSDSYKHQELPIGACLDSETQSCDSEYLFLV